MHENGFAPGPARQWLQRGGVDGVAYRLAEDDALAPAFYGDDRAGDRDALDPAGEQ